ncbi:reverse transcriptase domain-containing protein, partial [Tanacetum coccineum]
IVTPFQKSTGKLNLSAATPLSVSWTLTKAITRYRWKSQMRRKQLSTPAKGQVGRNIEVYVDDFVIKSHTETEMLRDINETFHTLRKINMKLNPKKYTFGAVEGMFLGYMISLEGIKPCPNKTEAVLQLPSGTSLQATEATLVEATPAGSTQTEGRTDCIPVHLPQSY